MIPTFFTACTQDSRISRSLNSALSGWLMSVAASLAEEGGLTLVGFLRGTAMNVHAGAERVAP